jgi:hypothetical protein
LLIYFLATYAKVPIRVIVTPISVTVEINPPQSPSGLNFLQDVTEILITSDGEGKTASDFSKPQ